MPLHIATSALLLVLFLLLNATPVAPHLLLHMGTSSFFKVQLKCHHLCEIIPDYPLPSPGSSLSLTPLFTPQKHKNQASLPAEHARQPFQSLWMG